MENIVIKKEIIERYRQALKKKNKKKCKFVNTDDIVVEISSEGYE
jgi:hypothetical protein